MKDSILHELQGFLGSRFSMVSLLQLIQREYGYLPEEVLREVAAAVHYPLIDLYRLATFYKSFSLAPRGKHMITSCCGTACHVRGGDRVTRELSKILGIAPGETTANGLYTLETVNCLGACAQAPLVVVDGDYFAGVTPAGARKLINGNLSGHECRCEAAAE